MCVVVASLVGCGGDAALEDALKQRDKAIHAMNQTQKLVQASRDNAETARNEAQQRALASEKAMRIAQIDRKKALAKLLKAEMDLETAKKEIVALEKEIAELKGKKK